MSRSTSRSMTRSTSTRTRRLPQARSAPPGRRGAPALVTLCWLLMPPMTGCLDFTEKTFCEGRTDLCNGVIHALEPRVVAVDRTSQTIEVVGTGFEEGVVARVDGEVVDVGWTNATRFRIMVPLRTAPGQVEVTLTNPGQSAIFSPEPLEYLEPPSLSSVSPSVGPKGGGTWVELTGDQLSAHTRVSFGGVLVPAEDVERVDPRHLRVWLPPGEGTVDVEVTHAGDRDTLENVFSYAPWVSREEGITELAGEDGNVDALGSDGQHSLFAGVSSVTTARLYEFDPRNEEGEWIPLVPPDGGAPGFYQALTATPDHLFVASLGKVFILDRSSGLWSEPTRLWDEFGWVEELRAVSGALLVALGEGECLTGGSCAGVYRLTEGESTFEELGLSGLPVTSVAASEDGSLVWAAVAHGTEVAGSFQRIDTGAPVPEPVSIGSHTSASPKLGLGTADGGGPTLYAVTGEDYIRVWSDPEGSPGPASLTPRVNDRLHVVSVDPTDPTRFFVGGAATSASVPVIWRGLPGRPLEEVTPAAPPPIDHLVATPDAGVWVGGEWGGLRWSTSNGR